MGWVPPEPLRRDCKTAGDGKAKGAFLTRGIFGAALTASSVAVYAPVCDNDESIAYLAKLANLP
jgi:hypothetical protein